jgi:hypothetical protein
VTQLPHQDRSRTEQRPSDERLSDPCLHTLEKLIDAKLATLRTIIDLHAEKSTASLAASDKAILKAEAATEKRFESVNEFRQTLLDQTNSFISRVEFAAVRDTNANRIADLASRLDKIEGKAVGLNAGWIYLLGGLSAAGTVASIIAAVLLNR